MPTKNNSMYVSLNSFGRAWIENFDPTPPYTIGAKTYTVQRTRDGVQNPTWQRIIANGGNATTNMTAVWMGLQSRKATASFRYKHPSYPTYVYRKEANGHLATTNIDFSDPTGPFKSTEFVYNLAAAQFNAKLRAIYQQMQGLTALGELRETLHMLRRPAQNMQRFAKDWLDHLKHRRKASPKAYLQNIGGAWLEHSFGWKPLINDINDSIDAYKDLQSRLTRPMIRKVSAGSKKTWDVTSTLATQVGSAANVYGVIYRCNRAARYEQHTIRFRGAVRAQSDTPGWNDVQKAYGLDVGSFIPTAWELLPWSFLADYFTNIGECLNSLTTVTTNVLYVNISVVTETSTYRDWFCDTGATHPGGAWYLDSGSGDPTGSILSKRVVSRSAGVGVPFPRLQMNFNLANGQLLNIAALLSQASALHPQSTTRKWHR